jgi:hypothetical protein
MTDNLFLAALILFLAQGLIGRESWLARSIVLTAFAGCAAACVATLLYR